MALTNFAALTTEQKTAWSRDLWKQARNMSFMNQFAGKGPNAMIQRITELTKNEKGARAVITLLADLESDGIVGDNTLEGNEEAIKSYDQVVRIDQIRNANRLAGRMADQKSIINFRSASKDVLAYWLSDRIDQLAILTLSGVTYDTKTNGAARTGSNLIDLEFAADVTAPSTNRGYRWDATTGLMTDGNANLAAGDKPSYAMLVELKALAKDKFIRGIRGEGGTETYHAFMTPQGMAALKLDADFLANVRSAGVRGGKNPLFAGSDSILVDGIYIHEFRHVYNTTGLAGGSKWGGGTVEGQRVLFCGAQALGWADLGNPSWDEESYDYGNQQGISVGKILGFKKPVFRSLVDGANEDFGVITCDTAI